jgi:hypothetical protein
MAMRLQRFVPLARTIAWPALLAGAFACVTAAVAATLLSGAAVRGYWPGFGGLALCASMAFVLDDPAAVAAGATPTSLVRRRLLRIALALPLPAAAWAASLWVATAADGAAFGAGTRAALSVQVAAVLALTLAASALALRRFPDERRGVAGAAVPLLVVGAASLLPERLALVVGSGDPRWEAAQHRWWGLLVVGILAFAWASRDPGAGRPVRLLRALSIGFAERMQR